MQDISKISDLTKNFEKVLELGIALSKEKNLDHFFKLVIRTAQDIARADASTLFLKEENKLHPKYLFNNTLKKPISIPSIPLDERYICAYVAIHGTPLSISNVYESDIFDFSGPKKYDRITGYHTQSMLVVPMRDSENEVIGVIELINAKDAQTGQIIPFPKELLKLLSSFAAQATVAFQRSQMIENLKRKVLDVQKLRETEEELSKKLKEAFKSLEIKNQKLEEASKNNRLTRYITFFLFIIFTFSLWIYKKDFMIDLTNLTNFTSSEEVTEESIYKNSSRVKRGIISDSITMTGILEPIKTVQITSPVAGIVQETFFNYGTKTSKDETLINLRSTELEILYRDAQAAYLEQEEKLKQLLNWENSIELAQARRSMKMAQLNLEAGQRELSEIDNLFKKDIVARQELDRADQAIIGLKNQYRSSQEQVNLVLEKGNKTNIAISRNRLRNAKAKLVTLEEQLDKTLISAPISGIIRDTFNKKPIQQKIEIGNLVKVGQPLLSIGSLSGFAIKAKADEVDILKIKTGQTVWVTGDAFPKLRLKGFVKLISSQAESTGSRRNSQPKFPIIVYVENLNQKTQKKLFIGMSANLQIVTYKNPTALVIPVNAVTMIGRRAYVNLKTTDGVIKKMINVGSTSIRTVEIKSGLKEGDEVVY